MNNEDKNLYQLVLDELLTMREKAVQYMQNGTSGNIAESKVIAKTDDNREISVGLTTNIDLYEELYYVGCLIIDRKHYPIHHDYDSIEDCAEAIAGMLYEKVIE